MFVFKGEHFFVYHGCGGVHGARVPACRFVGKSKKAKRPLFGTAGVSRCERAIVASYTAAGLRLAVAAPLPALPFDGGGDGVSLRISAFCQRKNRNSPRQPFEIAEIIRRPSGDTSVHRENWCGVASTIVSVS